MPSDLLPDPAGGVFSTLLVVDGRPQELGAHLARLEASARALYGRPLPAALRERVDGRAAGQPLARLRVTVAPRPDRCELSADVAVRPIQRALVLPGWRGGLALRAVAVRGWHGAHKWADRRLLDALEARAAPAGALLVDPVRGVLETTRANVFCVGADGVLRTPPADGTILPGIVRALALRIAAAAGVEVRQAPLTPAALASAREAFATGSIRGIEPIRVLDGRPLPGPGPVTTLLTAALARRWLGARAA